MNENTDTGQVLMARQIAGSQNGGVPSPSGAFPAGRRGRRPLINLAEIDKKAEAENAKNQAFNESRAARIKATLEAADQKFAPAAEVKNPQAIVVKPTGTLEPVTKLEEPPEAEAKWPDESPKPTAAPKAAVKKPAAKKAAKLK
tara:strand:- start:21636 stop:22067 length:432 start_codon:yes stop_codon:yes gene_type:complete